MTARLVRFLVHQGPELGTQLSTRAGAGTQLAPNGPNRTGPEPEQPPRSRHASCATHPAAALPCTGEAVARGADRGLVGLETQKRGDDPGWIVAPQVINGGRVASC